LLSSTASIGWMMPNENGPKKRPRGNVLKHGGPLTTSHSWKKPAVGRCSERKSLDGGGLCSADLVTNAEPHTDEKSMR